MAETRAGQVGRAGRPTVAIELSDEERKTLQRWTRRHSSSQALALRSRIVLACGEGETEIAAVGCNQVTLSKWRHRFAAERPEALGDALGRVRLARSVTRSLRRSWSRP